MVGTFLCAFIKHLTITYKRSWDPNAIRGDFKCLNKDGFYIIEPLNYTI